jgi:hypothetical protein
MTHPSKRKGDGFEWRPAVGFPDYEVSEDGSVRRTVTSQTRKAGSLPKGEITPRGGYRRYTLRKAGSPKKAWAHRLVAEAFIGPRPSERHFIAHNDGRPLNNHFTNLRWATAKENAADLIVHGTRQYGELNHFSKLSEVEVREMRSAVDALLQQFANQHGVTTETIFKIITFRSWRNVRSREQN